ncbi:transketolase [Dermatophilus congolensis]|uniref:Transketolase n=1 Tax=Dermatophilus congolensis TaxID=1863 RepID=A0A239VLX4_9MICO|nr:transketolase [Dermatophilus congolensis]MBO3129492.1 transketolase [Dermatophilus congolensis]MBO3131875.1 transketolase [Dermatophilus congolensis]MBO3133968.1 transketolase [Dermatophilus congolensis]MBO3136199.1 transketolase [Dermatophilus congolensis]MBO3138445.1 transketolase [Dermatophilus congolensis]
MSENSTATTRDASLQPLKADALGWTSTDHRAVDTAKILAADAVQHKGDGHPGSAVSLAPVAYLLYHDIMNYDPSDTHWLGRDRFVLSAGHSSLTQYIALYQAGIGLELEDIKALRTWGSKTPGHPEFHHTDGVEVTTGPLGSGLATAVGMAFEQRRLRGLLDPDAPEGTSPFDHHIYVLAGDGCLQEGVASEACSLAGTQQLGNLTLIYDQNLISIEDRTDISFTEDVAQRYESYGWDVRHVDWRGENISSEYVEDVDALAAAINEGKKVTDKPTIVILRTIISWPAPTKQDTGASHGSALGADEIANMKKLLGFDPEKTFEVDNDVITHTRESFATKGAKAREEWQGRYDAWKAANPERAAFLQRLIDHKLPDGFAEAFPVFEASEKGLATRAASGKILSALADVMPELWGGSADLAGSNNTTMDGQPSFIPAEHSTSKFSGTKYGRTLHFGIRENGMGMILNGIALSGLTRPYGGTFLTFSDYMRPAVRLAALQDIPATFVWTHDSIGLGEDGPTHQPIEHLPSLRLIPQLDVVRPGDANETAIAWRTILENRRATGIVLSRQAMPTLDRTRFASAEGVAKGAYVLADTDGTPDVVIIGTGSELHLAVQAAEQLSTEGIKARVVSAPCLEWFEAQEESYRESVIPTGVKARVAVEAAHPALWRTIVGDAGRVIGIDHFGASADSATLYREFGITTEAVVAAAKESIAAVEGN